MTTAGQFENVLHASANSADSAREVALWFEDGEILP